MHLRVLRDKRVHVTSYDNNSSSGWEFTGCRSCGYRTIGTAFILCNTIFHTYCAYRRPCEIVTRITKRDSMCVVERKNCCGAGVGNHIIYRCLQVLSSRENFYIINIYCQFMLPIESFINQMKKIIYALTKFLKSESSIFNKMLLFFFFSQT